MNAQMDADMATSPNVHPAEEAAPFFTPISSKEDDFKVLTGLDSPMLQVNVVARRLEAEGIASDELAARKARGWCWTFEDLNNSR